MEHKSMCEDWKERAAFLGRINIYKNTIQNKTLTQTQP
jgi:hypothetical protein